MDEGPIFCVNDYSLHGITKNSNYPQNLTKKQKQNPKMIHARKPESLYKYASVTFSL